MESWREEVEEERFKWRSEGGSGNGMPRVKSEECEKRLIDGEYVPSSESKNDSRRLRK